MGLKFIAIIGTAALLGGCGTMNTQNEWYNASGPAYGDAPGDPCIRCGEDWIFIPNEPLAAIKAPQRRTGFDWTPGQEFPSY